MVIKEFRWLEAEIRRVLAEVRSEAKMQVLKYPGAVAHRLHGGTRTAKAEKKTKRDR
jgi:hypothetical protein